QSAPGLFCVIFPIPQSTDTSPFGLAYLCPRSCPASRSFVSHPGCHLSLERPTRHDIRSQSALLVGKVSNSRSCRPSEPNSTAARKFFVHEYNGDVVRRSSSLPLPGPPPARRSVA